jgi:predicted secreted Zn-dependent protease
VTITSNFSESYYAVTGTTIDELNASLRASPLRVGGQVALGVTGYKLAISGAACRQGSACVVGQMQIDIEGSVTLPQHAAPASMPKDVATIWAAFANLVKVHEYRHVKIVEEGAAEIKRQILALPPQADCPSVDREVEDLWDRGSFQIEQRQEAFHIADAMGAGGSVIQ